MRTPGCGLLARLVRYRPKTQGKQKEDFLTEAWAHLLEQDRDLLKAAVRRIFGDRAARDLKGREVRVKTQPTYAAPEGGPDRRPDLVISVDGKDFICEHKLGAPLSNLVSGKGSVNQIEAYLRLKRGPVALVAKDPVDIPPEVLRRRAYRKPRRVAVGGSEPAGHFTWRHDIYPLIQAAAKNHDAPWLHEELLGLLDCLDAGPAPLPDPFFGDLGIGNEPELRPNKEKFDRLLGPVKAWLMEQGWSKGTFWVAYPQFIGPEPGVGLYFSGGTAWRPRHLQLKLRVPELAVDSVDEFTGRAMALDDGVFDASVRPNKTDSGEPVIDTFVSTPLTSWLEGFREKGPEAVEARLLEFVKLAHGELVPLMAGLARVGTAAPAGGDAE